MPTPAPVLVVDDSSLVRRRVSAALTRQGYCVIEAVDGVDALGKLGEHTDTRLIICDVNMPNMNGLELLEQLQERGSQVPVVMLTTEGEPELIRRAKSLGAKGWLIKPFKTEMLAATVEKLASVTA